MEATGNSNPSLNEQAFVFVESGNSTPVAEFGIGWELTNEADAEVAPELTADFLQRCGRR